MRRLNYDLKGNIKKFWNSTPERNAHLGLSGEAEFLLARYKNLIGDKVPVRGKTVIDFGHGGGLLGRYLLAECEVKKYVGYDIAERSNRVASENLREFDNKELILLQEHRWDFAAHRPGVIVCLACIFHFPTKLYLDNFLKTCEESGARYLVLEIRDRGHGTKFQPEPYSAESFALRPRTCLTCDTTADYVAGKLPSYELTEKTEINPKNGCQILWFRRG